ncbi:hypothetical protein [Aquamicrobium defluvii]|uniref:Uncharacterized protein n=1 Tax=Aquamicrobium defluvii TaxID=69279 RepID=A0A4R6YF59_9HYPH|nr:hypothetical protein [Aquamicrobium defluvii]TDR34843.1 hypothetical protein DES43_11255 [Aquamicrobium defluvii]
MTQEAVRAYTESNRLNRERPQSEDATRRELAEIVRVEQGGYHRPLSATPRNSPAAHGARAT